LGVAASIATLGAFTGVIRRAVQLDANHAARVREVESDHGPVSQSHFTLRDGFWEA
jgi:hypothetical protein